MKDAKEQIQKLCGNCRKFNSHKGKTLYTRGAGHFQVNYDLFMQEKMRLKDGERPRRSVPQIFAHMGCSNNQFTPR